MFDKADLQSPSKQDMNDVDRYHRDKDGTWQSRAFKKPISVLSAPLW